MATSEIGLTQLPASDAASGERQLNEEHFGPADGATNIPPADRGKAAYLFLLACFTVEGLVWGFAFTFGIFQEYYSKAFPGQANIAVIGTCCMVRTSPSARPQSLRSDRLRRASHIYRHRSCFLPSPNGPSSGVQQRSSAYF
jgi:hypothetical protein